MAAADKMKVVVIGAGPVGALAALYAAERGHDVDVYELRDDLRLATTTPLNFTKSINLALSERGINAIRHARQPALLAAILADTVPMQGRMVHTRDAATGAPAASAQRYDAFGRVQRAADRAALNARLLDALQARPNVRLHFGHKLTGADFRRNRAWLEVRGGGAPAEARARAPEIEIGFDLLLGADGAHSAARFHLMKFARMSYAQDYIDTLWCEFRIAPVANAGGGGAPTFAMPPHHLHIWPSADRDFMFIAIPSADGSFTCTLFAPAARFAALDADPAALLAPFFDAHFPGVAGALIPADALVAQYQASPHLPLISIKCAPHAHAGCAVLLGDAAHAMLPFYGQGMNAGLEDVRVLFAALDAAAPGERAAALAAYSAQRVPDAHAINDLAAANYAEMRAGVVSPVYRARKVVEEWLASAMPASGFATQYARVSFSNERYSDVIRAVAWQGRVLAGAAGVGLAAAMSVAGWTAWRTWRR